MSDGKSTQAHHLVRLNTVLGETALMPVSLQARESMSQGFTFSLSVFSETHHTLSARDLVGTMATVGLVQTDDSIRYFNGYINEIIAEGSARAGQQSNYHLSIVSWVQLLLAKRSDCRIFQDKSVDDVVREVFKPYGDVANYKLDLGSHPKRRFWVQYNETDQAFLHRICAREGLAYYFKHDNGAHKLHIVDKSDALATLNPKAVKLQPHTHAHDHLMRWENTGRFVTGEYEQRSYNYMSPSKNLKVTGKASTAIADVPRVMDVQSYYFSEGYHNDSEGKADIQRVASQGVERSQVATGSGNCRHLQVGQHFSVELATGGDFADKGKTFTLTEVVIAANDTTGELSCSIEAVPKDELVYPSANMPTIAGPQTAIVTGPKGEEIHTDQYGRVKVQFHWDRLGKGDQDTTCWLRVMQSVAGPSFGAHFTPRIGQEVVVAFENGNPDRPFVIGALYHPEHIPPYADQKGTRAGIRTRSTKGGSANNCNELYFEDKKGGEEVYLQAEKDLNALVKHNEVHKVGNKFFIDAKQEIRLQVGSSVLKMTPNKIAISSPKIDIDGDVDIN